MAKTAAVKIEVRWREQGTDQWSDIQSVPVTSRIVVEGLDRTKTYEFEYRGVSACGARSAWGSTAHAIPDVGPDNIVLADVKTQADNAAADALAANQELANIASDNVLSQGEKPTVIRDVNVINAEQAGIDTQANAFGITTEKTAYDNAVSALTTYLATLTTPTLWSDLSGDTTIVGTTFRSKFQDVYTNRQALLNAIYAAAKAKADAAQTSANSANSLATQVPIINGGFDATPYGTGWTMDSQWSIKSDGAGPGLGAGYAQFTPNGSNGAIYNGGRVGVVPGQTYKAQALIRGSGTPNGVAYVRIIWLNSAGAEVAHKNGNTITGNVTAGSYAVDQVPAGAYYAATSIEVDGCTTGTYQVDNVVATLMPAHLGEVPDTTGRYAVVNGASLNAVSSIDGGNRALIDFSQGGHFNKQLDNIGDGSTYYRMPAANMDGSRRALIDFTQAGHVSKNLDNIGDGTTYGRPLGARLNAGNPLIDFAAGYHLNKNVDNLADGTTYARPLASRISAGKPVIDFSEGIHFNKNLDYVGDGSTYIRSMLPAGGGSQWDIDNASFQTGGLGGGAPGWTGFGSASTYLQGGSSPAPGYGSQFLVIHTASGNGGATARKKFYPKPGDMLTISALVYANSSQYTAAQINFYTSSGSYISSIGAGTTSANWTNVSNSGVVPASTGFATVTLQVNAANTYGSFNFVQVTVNDVRIAGSGAKAYVDFSDNTASGHLNKNIDYMADGSTYGRPLAARLSSGNPLIDFSAGYHLNKNVDNLADGSSYVRMPTATTTGSGTARRALIDFTQGHTGKNVDNLADGTTYARIKGTELWSGVHKLGVAGSGAVLGNQLNIPNSLTLNYGAVRSATALTASSTGAVSVNAFTYYMGAASPSYSAVSNAVTGLTQGVSYYIYTRDAGGLGGTKTWSATTNINALLQTYDDIVVAGQVTIPTSGSSGGGGSGACVCDSMLIDHGMMAGDMQAGDVADCMDLPSSGLGKFRRALTGVERSPQLCVRITTDGGAVLECSESTPFDLPGGGVAYAPHMRGRQVMTDHGVEVVARVEYIGMQPVSHLHFGGCSYAAGRDAAHRIYSHNQINKP